MIKLDKVKIFMVEAKERMTLYIIIISGLMLIGLLFAAFNIDKNKDYYMQQRDLNRQMHTELK